MTQKPWVIFPMRQREAENIPGWTYGGEYAVYDISPGPETVRELLNGDYYAACTADHILEGYFCFGNSARIPIEHPETVYLPYCTDIGLGLRPDLCGKGLGTSFLLAGMQYAVRQGMSSRFQLMVASFNQRAVTCYERAGFCKVRQVRHKNNGMEFWQMTAQL